MPELLTQEERDEINAQITSVASKRVTWEAARDSAYSRAAQYFTVRKDVLASAFRELGDEFEANRRTASEEQQKLLNRIHPELKR